MQSKRVFVHGSHEKTLRIVFCAFSLLVKMLKIRMKWKNDGFFFEVRNTNTPKFWFVSFHFAQKKGWMLLNKRLLPVWGSSPMAFGEFDDVASICGNKFLKKNLRIKGTNGYMDSLKNDGPWKMWICFCILVFFSFSSSILSNPQKNLGKFDSQFDVLPNLLSFFPIWFPIWLEHSFGWKWINGKNRPTPL